MGRKPKTCKVLGENGVGVRLVREKRAGAGRGRGGETGSKIGVWGV